MPSRKLWFGAKAWRRTMGNMTHAHRTQRHFRARTAHGYAVLLLLFYAVVILIHRQPPLLGDMSNWVYSGVILARHMHGLPDAFHSIRFFPVPNTTNTLLLGVLSYFVRWQLAIKLYLLLQLAFSYCAMRALIKAARSPAWVWLVAPGAVFLNINFWYGLFAFGMGVCFVFLLTAMLIRRLDEDLPDWPIGLMLVLLFFTHMVSFTLALVLVFFFALQVGKLRLLLQAVLPAMLVVVYAVCRFASGNPDSVSAPAPSLSVGSGLFWAYKVNTFAKSFGFVNPTAWGHSVALAAELEPLFVAMFILNLLLCLALAFLLLPNLLPGNRGDRLPFLRLTVALTMPAYLLLPPALLGIADPGSRVMQGSLWLLLLVSCADSPFTRTAIRVAATASVLLAVSGAFLFSRVPWAQPRHLGSNHLPTSVEQLARVPYADAGYFYDALDRGDFTMSVFATGVLANLFPR